MEPTPEQCDMGRETAVVQGYSQGMAPSNWYEALIRALQGMAFVHRLGFAHRDLKSQNVLYDIDSGHAKVLQGVCGVCA